jgi:stage V sporulation protein B
MLTQGHSEKQAAEFLGMFTGKYNTLIHIPLAVANALGSSLIPSLTASVANGTKQEIRSKISMVIRFAMLVAIPSCVAFFVMPHQILSLLYVGNISIPAKMLRIGAITVVFYCLSTVTNSILQGLKKMTTPVKHGAISLVIHLVAVVIMLAGFKWGIYSLVLGNVVFAMTMCVLNARALKQIAGYRLEIHKTILMPFIASAVMGLVSVLAWKGLALVMLDKLATLITILLAIAVYGITLLKTGCLSPEDIMALPKGETILNIFMRLHLIKRSQTNEAN